MKKIAIGLLLLLIPGICLSHLAWEKNFKTPERKYRKQLAFRQINLLKEGVLLVQLNTKSNTIIALKKSGYIEKANKVENQQRDFNQSVIAAFRQKFDFCPVLFFYSDDAQWVKEKAFDRIVFLNNSLEQDTSIKYSGQGFLTAGYGTVEQDSAKYFDGYSYTRDADEIRQEKKYYSSPDMGINALIIRSDQFIQLRRPFRYYSRTYNNLPFEKSTIKVVKKMNKKLNKFLNKSGRWAKKRPASFRR